MHSDDCVGITIIDVENLGQPALVVNTSGPKLLLLDTGLTCEERIKILTRFLPKNAA